MPIATVAPLPQVSLDDAIRTFHVPSNVLALACVAGVAMARIVAKRHLRKPFMTRPCGLTMRGSCHGRGAGDVRGVTPEGALASVTTSNAGSVHPCPGLAAAEHAAEGAALHAQAVGALQRDRGVVSRAGVGIEDTAGPFLVLAGLHIDQDLLAALV